MNQRLKSMAAVMLAAMMTVTTNAQVTAPDWENPAVLGINKLSMVNGSFIGVRTPMKDLSPSMR